MSERRGRLTPCTSSSSFPPRPTWQPKTPGGLPWLCLEGQVCGGVSEEEGEERGMGRSS